MNVLAIDPGQRGCGVGLLSNESNPCAGQCGICDGTCGPTLIRAAYVRNPVGLGDGAASWAGMGRAVAHWIRQVPEAHRIIGGNLDLIIECPRVYPVEQQKGGTKGQNDLIALAAVAGAVVGALNVGGSVRSVYPRDWKGTLDPDEMTARIRSRLTREERARCEPCPKSLEHNLLDGVGIGLWSVGRLTPHRVIAR